MDLSGFKPSNKYLLMTREFYKEIKGDLDRVRTAIDIDDARRHADYLMLKLKDKFEAPAYNINRALASHEQAYRDPSKKFELAPLDDTGKELS